MTMPYGPPPTDHYSTDGETLNGYDWQPTQPAAAPLVPYQPSTPAPYVSPEIEARNERRAITGRAAMALGLAIPLTSIAGAMMMNSSTFASLIAMAMTWMGIAMVVYLSHGKGFPFPRNR